MENAMGFGVKTGKSYVENCIRLEFTMAAADATLTSEELMTYFLIEKKNQSINALSSWMLALPPHYDVSF
tara:strand:+ start:7142 stop:7351 length:210 start_codon:yes stop_codon:yes gene_type:complete